MKVKKNVKAGENGVNRGEKLPRQARQRGVKVKTNVKAGYWFCNRCESLKVRTGVKAFLGN